MSVLKRVYSPSEQLSARLYSSAHQCFVNNTAMDKKLNVFSHLTEEQVARLLHICETLQLPHTFLARHVRSMAGTCTDRDYTQLTEAHKFIRDDWTALQLTVLSNDAAFIRTYIETLLERKSQPEIFHTENGQHSALLAAQFCSVEVLQVLMDNGAELTTIKDAQHHNIQRYAKISQNNPMMDFVAKQLNLVLVEEVNPVLVEEEAAIAPPQSAISSTTTTPQQNTDKVVEDLLDDLDLFYPDDEQHPQDRRDTLFKLSDNETKRNQPLQQEAEKAPAVVVEATSPTQEKQKDQIPEASTPDLMQFPAVEPVAESDQKRSTVVPVAAAQPAQPKKSVADSVDQSTMDNDDLANDSSTQAKREDKKIANAAITQHDEQSSDLSSLSLLGSSVSEEEEEEQKAFGWAASTVGGGQKGQQDPPSEDSTESTENDDAEDDEEQSTQDDDFDEDVEALLHDAQYSANEDEQRHYTRSQRLMARLHRPSFDAIQANEEFNPDYDIFNGKSDRKLERLEGICDTYPQNLTPSFSLEILRCFAGTCDVLQLEHFKNAEHFSENRVTALQFAVLSNSENLVPLFLQVVCGENQRRLNEAPTLASPVLLAAQYCYIDVLQMLAEAGADLRNGANLIVDRFNDNEFYENFDQLPLIAARYSLAIMNDLVDANADLGVRDTDRRSIVEYALESGNVDIVDLVFTLVRQGKIRDFKTHDIRGARGDESAKKLLIHFLANPCLNKQAIITKITTDFPDVSDVNTLFIAHPDELIDALKTSVQEDGLDTTDDSISWLYQQARKQQKPAGSPTPGDFSDESSEEAMFLNDSDSDSFSTTGSFTGNQSSSFRGQQDVEIVEGEIELDSDRNIDSDTQRINRAQQQFMKEIGGSTQHQRQHTPQSNQPRAAPKKTNQRRRQAPLELKPVRMSVDDLAPPGQGRTAVFENTQGLLNPQNKRRPHAPPSRSSGRGSNRSGLSNRAAGPGIRPPLPPPRALRVSPTAQAGRPSRGESAQAGQQPRGESAQAGQSPRGENARFSTTALPDPQGQQQRNKLIVRAGGYSLSRSDDRQEQDQRSPGRQQGQPARSTSRQQEQSPRSTGRLQEQPPRSPGRQQEQPPRSPGRQEESRSRSGASSRTSSRSNSRPNSAHRSRSSSLAIPAELSRGFTVAEKLLHLISKKELIKYLKSRHGEAPIKNPFDLTHGRQNLPKEALQQIHSEELTLLNALNYISHLNEEDRPEPFLKAFRTLLAGRTGRPVPPGDGQTEILTFLEHLVAKLGAFRNFFPHGRNWHHYIPFARDAEFIVEFCQRVVSHNDVCNAQDQITSPNHRDGTAKQFTAAHIVSMLGDTITPRLVYQQDSKSRPYSAQQLLDEKCGSLDRPANSREWTVCQHQDNRPHHDAFQLIATRARSQEAGAPPTITIQVETYSRIGLRTRLENSINPGELISVQRVDIQGHFKVSNIRNELDTLENYVQHLRSGDCELINHQKEERDLQTNVRTRSTFTNTGWNIVEIHPLSTEEHPHGRAVFFQMDQRRQNNVRDPIEFVARPQRVAFTLLQSGFDFSRRTTAGKYSCLQLATDNNNDRFMHELCVLAQTIIMQDRFANALARVDNPDKYPNSDVKVKAEDRGSVRTKYRNAHNLLNVWAGIEGKQDQKVSLLHWIINRPGVTKKTVKFIISERGLNLNPNTRDAAGFTALERIAQIPAPNPKKPDEQLFADYRFRVAEVLLADPQVRETLTTPNDRNSNATLLHLVAHNGAPIRLVKAIYNCIPSEHRLNQRPPRLKALEAQCANKTPQDYAKHKGHKDVEFHLRGLRRRLLLSLPNWDDANPDKKLLGALNKHFTPILAGRDQQWQNISLQNLLATTRENTASLNLTSRELVGIIRSMMEDYFGKHGYFIDHPEACASFLGTKEEKNGRGSQRSSNEPHQFPDEQEVVSGLPLNASPQEILNTINAALNSWLETVTQNHKKPEESKMVMMLTVCRELFFRIPEVMQAQQQARERAAQQHRDALDPLEQSDDEYSGQPLQSPRQRGEGDTGSAALIGQHRQRDRVFVEDPPQEGAANLLEIRDNESSSSEDDDLYVSSGIPRPGAATQTEEF